MKSAGYVLSIDTCTNMVRRYRRGAYGGVWCTGEAKVEVERDQDLAEALESFRVTGRLDDVEPVAA